MDLEKLELEPRRVDHLPVVRAVMEQLGIVEVVDELLPKRPLARVSDGDCVAAMVLNILSGRMALFRMEAWLRRTDTELLLGKGREPDAFNDTRLAEALDHIDALGTDCIMGAVVELYLLQPDRPTSYSVHTDHTSFKLWGEYDNDDEPNVTYGFSKDKRPDLKQLMYGLSLHGAVGLPLVVSIAAGNTSDHIGNRDHIAQLAKLLPDSDDVTIVADCKLVDAESIGRVLGSGFHLVSLVPDTFSLRGSLIEDAWSLEPDCDAWPKLSREAGRTKASPDKVYRGRSVERPFPVTLRAGGDPANDAVASTEDMRFLVVYSSNLAARFERSVEKKLRKERERLERFVKRTGQRGFDCAADARRAADEVVSKVKLHTVDVTVDAEVRKLKRKKRGRPPAGERPPTETRWVVRLEHQVNDQAVDEARRKASCFVLITDKLDEGDGPTDDEILREYRHQYIVENHTGFRWLKSEGRVSPMFLKTPSRIRAMGLVLVLALMVRNYLQFRLRGALRDRNETLPHPFTNKEVNNLTTEMAMEWFADTAVIHARIADNHVRHPPTLCDPARRILQLLNIPVTVFARPPP